MKYYMETTLTRYMGISHAYCWTGLDTAPTVLLHLSPYYAHKIISHNPLYIIMCVVLFFPYRFFTGGRKKNLEFFLEVSGWWSKTKGSSAPSDGRAGPEILY